jgi:TorA maturation chaperone TorD
VVEQEFETARARVNLYGILAFMAGREPDETFLEKLNSPVFFKAAKELGLSPPQVPAPGEAEAFYEGLAAEFARLFIVPGTTLHPYESVQRGEGRLWGEVTVKVQQAYHEAGFELAPEVNPIPDHLAVELEFMSHLASQEADYWQAGSKEDAEAMQERQRSFLEEHLGQWSPSFARSLREETTHPYFIFLADMLEAVVESDGSFLADPS